MEVDVKSYGSALLLDDAYDFSETDYQILLFAIEDFDWTPPQAWLNKIFKIGLDFFILIRQNENNYLIYI